MTGENQKCVCCRAGGESPRTKTKTMKFTNLILTAVLLTGPAAGVLSVHADDKTQGPQVLRSESLPGGKVPDLLRDIGIQASSHFGTDPIVPGNIRLSSLPPYSPELNPQEYLWEEVREKQIPNRVPDSLERVKQRLRADLVRLARDFIRVRSQRMVMDSHTQFESKQE